jgi:IS30 family transposase
MFDNIQQAGNTPRMATPRETTHQAMRTKIRELKAGGMSIYEIATQLLISKSLVHHYSKRHDNEKVCPRCCRPWARAKKVKTTATI